MILIGLIFIQEITINDKQKDFWDINFKNGAVVLSHKKSIANVSTVEYHTKNSFFFHIIKVFFFSNMRYFDLAPKIPSPGIPLVTKINLRKNEEKRDDALAKISTASGVSMYFFFFIFFFIFFLYFSYFSTYFLIVLYIFFILMMVKIDDWALVVDFVTTLPQLEKNSQDRIGDIYYGEVINALAKKYV